MNEALEATTCSLSTFFGTSSANGNGWNLTGLASYDGPVGIWTGDADPFLPETQSLPAHFPAASVEYAEIADCGHYWQECQQDFLGLAVPLLADAL
jgi:pimeloyl-ACP methyl ester carboxylesterase